MSVIVLGDDSEVPVTLKKNKATFSIDAGAVIKAAVVNTDRDTVIAGPVTVNNNATGSDLANSLIVVEFTEEETGAITVEGDALLEIQVLDGKKKTWWPEVFLVRGLIE